MRSEPEKRKSLNRTTAPASGYECLQRRIRFYHAINFLIIISFILWGTTALSEDAPNIRGVQIELGNGNRVCMSLEGKITGIIVNGSVNLPGGTFENITKVGNTKISRSHSGKLTRIGHIGIHRNWRGKIIKIGAAKVRRDKNGSVIAVSGDPNVSPLFAINL